MSIQNMDDTVYLNKDDITSDFHYANTEEKMTGPWFDNLTFLQMNHSKNIHQQNEVANKDTSKQPSEELNEIVKIKRPTIIRRKCSRSLLTSSTDYKFILMDAKKSKKDSSMLNCLKVARSTLKSYYNLLNNSYISSKPKEKYKRAHLFTSSQTMELDDYNYELELMAYMEYEDNQTDWERKPHLLLQDSSVLLDQHL
ncbi:hypothetical protein [Psychrobacillus sp. FSL K6-1267]|uniref:hypothetical protein n=2 Tax=unclassified Psychrobacillus TaxID=2636677 RepID=UPI0030F80924